MFSCSVKDRRRLISKLKRPGPRRSPAVWFVPPNQNWLAMMDPFGATTVCPWNAHELYFRKVFLAGVILTPHGSVTVVFPSYQCCSSCGTVIATPASRLTAPESAPVFAPETTNGNPLLAMNTEPTLQPPAIAEANLFLSAMEPPLPNGDSYRTMATKRCGWSDNP